MFDDRFNLEFRTDKSKLFYLFLCSPPNTQTNKVWMNTLSNIRLSRLESYKTSILLGKCAKVYSKGRHLCSKTLFHGNREKGRLQ